MGADSVVDEVEAAIRQAASGQTVVMIRLAIGKEVSVAKAQIAGELHRRFPEASVEITESALTDSVVVKDIEVE